MEDTHNIRLYREGDERGIFELLKKVFPLWKLKKLDHWMWKYVSSPLESDIAVAEMDSKIIGVGHRINFSFKIGDRTQVCTYGDDWGVDSEHRRKGINSSILELLDNQRLKKNITTMYTQTINPIVANLSLKRGRVNFPHRITRLIKVKNINTHLKNRPRKNDNLVRLGFSIFKIINKIISSTIPLNKSIKGIKINDIVKFDKNIDDFWDKIRSDYSFTLEKNKEYMNWRLDRRGGNYFIKQALQNKEMVGYVAFEIRNIDDYKEVYILDILTLSNDSYIAFLLIKEVINYCESNDVNVVYYQNVVSNPYQKIFYKLGFLDSGSSPYILLDITEEDYEVLEKSNPEQISYTYLTTLH